MNKLMAVVYLSLTRNKYFIGIVLHTIGQSTFTHLLQIFRKSSPQSHSEMYYIGIVRFRSNGNDRSFEPKVILLKEKKPSKYSDIHN